MFQFFTDNLASILVGAIVFSAVAAVVVKMVRDRKHSKSSCGGGCAGCPSAGMCGSH